VLAATDQDDPAIINPPFVEVFALGGFRVLVSGRLVDDQAWRRRSARQLFKILLGRPNRRMARDEVIELLWPESDPAAASTNLRSTIHAMRRVLEPPALASLSGVVFGDRDSVWLRPPPELWVDADAFESEVKQASQAADPFPLLQHASRAYAGDYLPDDLYEDWAIERRDALKRAWTNLQFQLAEAVQARGQPEAAVGELQRLLAADRCDERAAQELMHVLIQLRRRSDALRVYQTLEQSLRDELGVEPSERTHELQRLAATAGAPTVSRHAVFQCSYSFPEPKQLIGRESELERLQTILERGRATGQLILVSAPAGTGKSALAGALVKLARRAGFLCLAGAAYDERSAVPLAAFQEALTDYVLATATSPIDAAVSAATAELIDARRELRQHPSVSGSVPLDASAERSRLFAAILALLRTLADRAPVLMCLENLHIAGEATLNLLHYLVRQTRHAPVVFVATLRSEALQPGEPMAQGIAGLLRERLAEQVELPPLDQAATDRLVAMLVDGPVSSGLTASVYASTDGNPLFVEQLVLALRDAGRLNRTGAAVRQAVADVSNVPIVVRELIAERLARLNPRGRQTLETAAVLGHAFDYATLLAVIEPAEESTLLTDLDEAIQAQLLRDRRPAGFAFSHSLMPEGVYWGLSKPRRMLLHGRVGEVLERRAGDNALNMSAELAHHFGLDGLAPPIVMKALLYSLRAGRQAAALASNREALRHFELASSLIDQGGVEVDAGTRLVALEGRGLAERNLGLWRNCLATLDIVLAQSTDGLQRARTYDATGRALTQVGEIVAALRAYDAGLFELEAVSDPQAESTRLQIRFNQAFCYLLEGAYRLVQELGEEMLRGAVHLREPDLLYRAHMVIGLAQTYQGQFAQAVAHHRAAIDAAEVSGDRLLVAVGRENLGAHHYLSGHLDAARDELRKAIDLYQASVSDLRAVLALRTLSRVHIATGDLVEASTTIDRARELALEGQDRWAAECNSTLAAIHSLRGEWDAGEACYTQALREHQRVGHATGGVETLIGLGVLHDRRGNWARAGGFYQQAVEASNAIDQGPLRLAAVRHAGVHMLRHGDQAMGAAYIREALAIAESMRETLEYAPALLAMAELVGQQDLSSAIAYAEQAIEVGRAAELEAQAHIFLAAAHAVSGRTDAAREHAQRAVRVAEQLGSPWLVEQATDVVPSVARTIRRVS